MNQTSFPPRRFWQRCLAAAVLGCLTLLSVSAQAQQVTTLIEFTNVWRYDASGANLGREWRSNTFSDAAWPEGRAMFGYEPDAASIVNYNTAMRIVPNTTPFNSPFPQLTTVTTYYFRTTFHFTGNLAGLSLITSNLLDDGMVIHLNGAEVGRLRTPSNQTANTQPTGSPPGEGVIEPMVMLSLGGAIREGENLLAVEVHNTMSASYDMAFGMKLMAVQQTPLVITNQPQSQAVTLGDPVVLSVGVSGGPVSYRWQKDGVNLTSTSNRLVLASAQLANSGNYRAVCSNAITVVTSSVATLTVFADLSGPTVLSAIGDNGFGTNSVNIKFSETMNTASARNTTNYTVTRLGTTSTVTIANIPGYSPALGVLLQLDAGDPDWIPYANYMVTINNVIDSRGNVIAPNTAVPVSWVYTTNLLQASRSWDFHASAIFEPEVFDEPWFACDYVPGPWWGQGNGPFYGGFIISVPCPSFGVPRTMTGWQPEPILFRTTFSYPADWPASATLRLKTAFDDGLVLYLNGVEIYRNFVLGTAGSPVNASTRSLYAFNPATCDTGISINVTNLNPGSNCLAAAAVQFGSGTTTDTAFNFVLEMDATVLFAPALPPEPLPILQATSPDTNSLRLSWTGGGYALESSTNLNLGPASYPFGPWMPAPQMSNPYLWNLTNSPARFFRLKK